jgi:hypothetical protein
VDQPKSRGFFKVEGRTVNDLGDEVSPEFSHVGGARLQGFNATWPLIRLDLFGTGLRLRDRLKLPGIQMPNWEARYDELTEVQAVGRTPLFSTGIRFRGAEPHEWIVFWVMTGRQDVLTRIESHGVPVGREAVRFYYTNPSR